VDGIRLSLSAEATQWWQTTDVGFTVPGLSASEAFLFGELDRDYHAVCQVSRKWTVHPLNAIMGAATQADGCEVTRTDRTGLCREYQRAKERDVDVRPRWYRCAGCHGVFYCSRRCQKVDWRHRHRALCRRLRAALWSKRCGRVHV